MPISTYLRPRQTVLAYDTSLSRNGAARRWCREDKIAIGGRYTVRGFMASSIWLPSAAADRRTI